MKTTILLSLMMTGVSFAAFEKWTNKDGKTAELELVKVEDSGGEKTGEFKMRSGKTVTLKISDLAEADAKRGSPPRTRQAPPPPLRACSTTSWTATSSASRASP